jgi:hypothetical protein
MLPVKYLGRWSLIMKRVVNVLVVWLAASVTAVASAADLPKSVAIPGGVAASAGKIGYITNPKGGIAAVGLEKGSYYGRAKSARNRWPSQVVAWL